MGTTSTLSMLTKKLILSILCGTSVKRRKFLKCLGDLRKDQKKYLKICQVMKGSGESGQRSVKVKVNKFIQMTPHSYHTKAYFLILSDMGSAS